MVDMINGSANTLLAVLNDILDFSTIEAGARSIVHEPVSLRELVSQLAEPYAIEAGRKGVALHVQFAHDLPTHVQTDPLRLRQILNTLLSNAIKFTAPWFRLSIRPDDRHRSTLAALRGPGSRYWHRAQRDRTPVRRVRAGG